MKNRKNIGDDILIPYDDWVNPKSIIGEDKCLKSPLMEKAFRQILKKHKPKHNICFISLCTSTRPYSKSPKWKKFKEYENKMDLVISSAGGVIPIEFENCYPYLTYDGYERPKNDKLYIQKTYSRLKIFLNRFDYKYIIFNFRPNLRNRISAEMIKKTSNNKDNIFIYPSKENYLLSKRNGFKPSTHYYPDLSFECMNELNEIIKEIENKEMKI